MDSSKAARQAAIHEERILQEARQRKNVHQEGALGAIPQGYGVVPPRVAGANEEEQRQNQHVANLLTQNPCSQNNYFRPVVLVEPPIPQGEDIRARMVITPIVGATASDEPQDVDQRCVPQLPTLKEFAAMPVQHPAPNAGARNLPAAPGPVGAANNAARARAVVAQRFVANAATAGVGQPIVVNEADAAAMRRPRRIDNIDVIDGLNRAMLETTTMIWEALRARCGRRGGGGFEAAENSLDRKLESLHKQRKLAVEAGDHRSIAHAERMIRILEEREAKEME
jgi:hypothetical protein